MSSATTTFTERCGGQRRPRGEWFETTLAEVKAAIIAVRTARSSTPARTEKFGMRPEQQSAVELTARYFHCAGRGQVPKFLWNAKMRFGKTFTTYQLAREMGWKRVLVLTYKPAVQTAWQRRPAHPRRLRGLEVRRP